MINNYNNEVIDYQCTEFFDYAQFIWPIKTTGDGNCLFHATSISIYGNECQSWNLKLCSAFIVHENQEFFKQILQSEGNETSIAMMIQKILKLDKWQDRLSIIALNVLIARPIYTFDKTIQSSHQTDILPPSADFRSKYPVNILFYSNHFMGLLGIQDRSLLPLPPMLANRFWKFQMQNYTVY